MASFLISALTPGIAAKSIFAGRRTKRSVEADNAPVSIMNACVASAQLAKAGEGIIGIAHESKGSLAAKIVNLDNALKEVPKTTGQITRFGMNNINGLIGATAAIKALCSDDKESAAIQEGTAFVGMLACEKAHKKVFGTSTSKLENGITKVENIEGTYKKVPLLNNTAKKIRLYCDTKSSALADAKGVKKVIGRAIKYAPEGIKGISFALTSIIGFGGFHWLGGEAAEAITGRQAA